MAIATITKQGLTMMAILVAVLWGCLVSERLTLQKANDEMIQALREVKRRHVKAHRPQPAGPLRHGRVSV